MNMDQFYITAPTDTADTINAALGSGKNLLITPGVYHLNAPLEVARAGTVILGLGMTTLIPDNGTPAIVVADVDGVKIAELMLDAGPQSSPTLLQVGNQARRRILSGPNRHPRPRMQNWRRVRGYGGELRDREQQRRDRRPVVALARRPRRRRGMDVQHE
jgi:hypothetical protein